LQGKLRVF